MKIVKDIIGLLIIAIVALLLTNNIIIAITKDFEIEEKKLNIDDIIITYLTENNIIQSDDFYQSFQKVDGHKKHIYSRFDGYYYIEIEPLIFKKDGIYEEYEYKANESFVAVKMQNCEYNFTAQFNDNLISDTYGKITTYIFKIDNNKVILEKTY